MLGGGVGDGLQGGGGVGGDVGVALHGVDGPSDG